MDFPGGSGIISPRGEYLAGPLYDKEGILYAQIDTDMIIRAKAVIDTVGHFSRPDIVRLEMRDQGNSSTNEYNEMRKTLDELRERYKNLETKVEELLKRGS